MRRLGHDKGGQDKGGLSSSELGQAVAPGSLGPSYLWLASLPSFPRCRPQGFHPWGALSLLLCAIPSTFAQAPGSHPELLSLDLTFNSPAFPSLFLPGLEEAAQRVAQQRLGGKLAVFTSSPLCPLPHSTLSPLQALYPAILLSSLN